jgi:hypothetical protein
MYKGLAKVCSIVCCLLVIAFIIGSFNTYDGQHDKKHNTMIESNVAIKPHRINLVPPTALHTVPVRPATDMRVDESKSFRTLRIPKEHLMVRSGYQQLGRLAFIYAHCVQHIKKVNGTRHVSKTMQVATRQLVALNQKVMNQYIMRYTKYQARVRGAAGKRVA